jgi:hypothetical protein
MEREHRNEVHRPYAYAHRQRSACEPQQSGAAFRNRDASG